jgi:hypothetical protein
MGRCTVYDAGRLVTFIARIEQAGAKALTRSARTLHATRVHSPLTVACASQCMCYTLHCTAPAHSPLTVACASQCLCYTTRSTPPACTHLSLWRVHHNVCATGGVGQGRQPELQPAWRPGCSPQRAHSAARRPQQRHRQICGRRPRVLADERRAHPRLTQSPHSPRHECTHLSLTIAAGCTLCLVHALSTPAVQH